VNGFHERNGVLHADDVALPELADRYATPLYVYSASVVRHNVQRLRDALAQELPAARQPLIAFACKANSNLAVLSLLGKMGLGCDVVSGGEMTRALRAGIPAEKIVYSGVGKSDEEIAGALDEQILQINVESKAELERIAAIAKEKNVQARITFRLNPDVAAKTHDKISTGRSEDKFGISRAAIEELYPWAAAHSHLAVQGLHMHIGSQLTDMEPFRLAYERLADFAAALKAKGLPVPLLDLGGGLGIVYGDEQPPDLRAYAKIIREVILPLDTKIILEPGRFIVGDAGLLLAKVSYIKESGSKRFIILDAGMNDLIRPALYGARHTVRPVKAGKQPAQDYDVVGPVCETGDTFLKDLRLPAVHKDDLIALMNAGAYGFVMASNYNTRPLPAEVMVDGGSHAIIRQRQSVQDILEEDRIPGWLS